MKKVKKQDTVWLSRKKFAFFQDWGTYPTKTFVAVGMAHEEILDAMRTMGCKKSYIKRYDASIGPDKDKAYEPNGAFTWKARGNSGLNLLWLSEWKNNMPWYANLVHETNHMIKRNLTDYRGMEDETEAQAYQQEYLFTRIAATCSKAIKLKHAPRAK